MWMPPGYMLLLAGVFRVFGYSFGIARWVSTVAALLSLALVAKLSWRLTTGTQRVLASLATMVAFSSPNMLISANVARMEQVFLLIILLAMMSAAAGRIYIAGSLIASAAVIHFNAVYFIPPIVLQFTSLTIQQRLKRPVMRDWLAAAAAAGVLGAYAIYAAGNWHAFLYDMSVQFRLKFLGGREPARWLWHLAAATTLTGLVAWRQRTVGAPLIIAAFGCSFVAMTDYGGECWYDYAQPLGLALVTISLLVSKSDAILRWASYAGLAVTAIAAVQLGNETPWALPRLPPFRRDLIPKTEMAKVHAFIATLHPGSTVNFGAPGLEPFFLADLARVGANWVIPAHSVTMPYPLRSWEWSVRCDSSDFSVQELRFDASHVRAGTDTGCVIFRDKP